MEFLPPKMNMDHSFMRIFRRYFMNSQLIWDTLQMFSLLSFLFSRFGVSWRGEDPQVTLSVSILKWSIDEGTPILGNLHCGKVILNHSSPTSNFDFKRTHPILRIAYSVLMSTSMIQPENIFPSSVGPAEKCWKSCRKSSQNRIVAKKYVLIHHDKPPKKNGKSHHQTLWHSTKKNGKSDHQTLWHSTQKQLLKPITTRDGPISFISRSSSHLRWMNMADAMNRSSWKSNQLTAKIEVIST